MWVSNIRGVSPRINLSNWMTWWLISHDDRVAICRYVVVRDTNVWENGMQTSWFFVVEEPVTWIITRCSINCGYEVAQCGSKVGCCESICRADIYRSFHDIKCWSIARNDHIDGRNFAVGVWWALIHIWVFNLVFHFHSSYTVHGRNLHEEVAKYVKRVFSTVAWKEVH